MYLRRIISLNSGRPAQLEPNLHKSVEKEDNNEETEELGNQSFDHLTGRKEVLKNKKGPASPPGLRIYTT